MKSIKGYEGLYAVTSCGKVWSYRTDRFIKPDVTPKGYLTVRLCKDGENRKCRVHRLVAEAFIPNPDNKPEINHRDEVKCHNHVGNLEWVTSAENANYGTRLNRISEKKAKPVVCVELERVYKSATEAAGELGLFQGNIVRCLKGRCERCGGYHWRYKE